MANKNSTENGVPPPATLQRGKACLRCRKRKMRCDGTRPACLQCTRAKKPDACEYDDGKGKTRTQLLRENIARLEQRIRELEDPEFTSPSVTLFDPHARRQSESSSSSLSLGDSPGGTPFSASHSPYASEPASSPLESWDQVTGVPSPSPSPLSDIYQSQLPFELSQMLLDIFEPHRHKCGLHIHMGRLRESLSLPLSEQRHPVLMNAIYLWACFVSRPGPLSQHESHYLGQALQYLSDALQFPERMIDAIQASCLLSLYFIANGRMFEGSYHANAAASLTVQWGLHGSILHDGIFGSEITAFKLDPPRDRIEEGERILTFWQVYILDRCWSVVLHKPACIPDIRNSYVSINVPWPLDMDEYGRGHHDESYNFQTIQSFLEGQASNIGGFSALALRAKASALFERADSLSASVDHPLNGSNTFLEDFRALEDAIFRFVTTLVPVHQLDAAMPEDKRTLVVTHTLAQAAIIHLYYRYAQSDPIVYDKCLRAARVCVNMIKHLADGDFEYLDPIIGPCWTCVGDTLIRELNSMESSWPLIHSGEVRNELGTVLYAMTSLSTKFPLMGFLATKIQDRLAQM